MFGRRPTRGIGVELPQLEQDTDLEMAIEVVKQTNLQQSRKWRNRAYRGRQNQRVKKDQLVWVQKDYTTSLGDRKLGLKWVGPYKVKEVIREGSAYKLEDVFEGVVIQRAADKVKPYVVQDNILTQPRKMFLQEDSEEEDEPRPVRNRIPPRRYAEEDYSRQRPEREGVRKRGSRVSCRVGQTSQTEEASAPVYRGDGIESSLSRQYCTHKVDRKDRLLFGKDC